MTTPNPRPDRRSAPAVEGDGDLGGADAVGDRDHLQEVAASWVAGVCDRGLRHRRNEDALALSAGQSHAVLVVCDGVSSSDDSDVASLAAARAARDVLGAPHGAGRDLGQPLVETLTATLARAARAAQDAVLAHTRPESRNPASCTFAAAVVVDDLIVFGSIGDSRVYWIADHGESLQLTVDDSVAQVQMEQGMSREQAENGPHSHAITRWLGRDAPDLVPTGGSLRVPGDGWLLVCSDGLWNYASAATDLAILVAEALTGDDAAPADPQQLAHRLVRWACDRGGRDNITVALARFGGARPAATR